MHRHRGKQGRENAFKGPLRDLGLHHSPCRRLLANQLFYACGQLAQTLLRTVQFSLPPASQRPRIAKTQSPNRATPSSPPRSSSNRRKKVPSNNL